ncbi:hypothetical protein Q664_04500 [Archangium violaceum Cb vi76]|uniref:Uncharacterized protein n=1 Tax=Archangium violaceum Cb vi76 TaxID=1406225 RepID=A0A084T0F1_9BACT|nr:hypothetical protein Q664_04500 [Archangium violaceum Cb vi76]
MLMLLLGAALLTAGQLLAAPSFWTFVVPMWLIAIGIVFAASVTAVVPTGKMLPDARPYSMTGGSRSSVAVAGA